MRIVFISTVHGHSWPGSEYLWADTAGLLLADRHQVYARCSSGFSEAEPLRKLVSLGMIYEPAQPPHSRIQRLAARIFDPFAKLKAWKSDLLVISAGSAYDIAYQPALAKYLLETKVPFIPICHFNAETFWVEEANRVTMRRIYEKAAASVFVCADNHRITERQLALKIDKFHVIRPPFPLVLENPLPWPESDCWNFACVARLESRWKGQDVLFEVLGGGAWRSRKWKLNLYGEGCEEDYLKNLARHYGIADRIVFHGFVSNRAEIWQDNHIQCFPTRGEGGPMVLTEGMMAGRCAVISDCGNTREYIQNGEDGFICDFPTASCFARTLEDAWARQSDWRAMGELAHLKIKKLAPKLSAAEEFLGVITQKQ